MTIERAIEELKKIPIIRRNGKKDNLSEALLLAIEIMEEVKNAENDGR